MKVTTIGCLSLLQFLAPHRTFGFGGFINIFGRKSPVSSPPAGKKSQESQTDAILKAISFTGNGKTATREQQRQVLRLVRTLELQSPPTMTILTNPTKTEIQLLDGIWFLQYTSPSEMTFPELDNDVPWTPAFPSEGDANIETTNSNARGFTAQGTVSAAGITVDTSNRVVQQIFTLATNTVVNKVTTDWGQIVVSGTFRPSNTVPNRALVAFDTAIFQWNNGFQINLGFVFNILALVRQSRENGWLETTYLDERMRIGRGNKGTLFVLTRDRDAVQP